LKKLAHQVAPIQEAVEHIKKALELIYGDTFTANNGMEETPLRIAKYWSEFKPDDSEKETILAKRFELPKSHDQIVLISDIPFVSLCEHHLLPFWGIVHVAYIPKDSPKKEVLGLSKIPRLVNLFASRPQIQERLGWEIMNELESSIEPLGCAVIISAEHSCMNFRGIRVNGSKTRTSCLSGLFKENSTARQELFNLISWQN
jgi:GTP cyclohydrolase I